MTLNLRTLSTHTLEQMLELLREDVTDGLAAGSITKVVAIGEIKLELEGRDA